ncbi:hypothetical protein CCYA_CCYA05G1513 [Cyanidiococcus yangmingshanensis]|nr:hypothetical protein CCYA_CCYA05G1513 [Cyanidiococcus yangmingshanensis]
MRTSKRVLWLLCGLAFVLGLFCALVDTANERAQSEPALESLKRLRSLRQQYETGLIPVKRASNLGSVVFTASERPYGVVLLFTSTAQEATCGLCLYLRHQVGQISRLVKQANARYESKGQLSVFFLMVDMDASNEKEVLPWLQTLQISTLPALIYVPAGVPSPNAKQVVRFRPEPPPTGDGLDGSALAGWVLRHTNADMQRLGRRPTLRISMGGPVYVIPALRRNWPLVCLLLCAALLLGWWFKWHQQPVTWFVLTLLMYSFALGGGHGWIIQGTPLFLWEGGRIRLRSNRPGVRRRGPASQDALAAEGFIEAGRYLLIAALMIALDRLPRKIQRSSLQLLCALAMLLLLAYLCKGILHMPMM